ncbi:hypothetical protein JL721_11147 [Aureococcus anophagefferens]|nr:hypothetical protein JL721_11147 [Aureococcus anophagefferens]
MSYEQMRAHSDDFVAGGTVLDLVVFDEAHRLKDSLSVTARATASLTTRRRLLLTATPVSNCLEELRALLCLVESDAFARTRGLDCFEALFGGSIAAGRRDGASKAARLAGDVAETLLREKLANALLRRGVDVLAGELQSASSRVHDLVRA